MPTSNNALRYQAGARGHVESYFWRANHPTRPLAFWLKATILAPKQGEPVAELWCIVFDGEKHRHWANKSTVPFRDASFIGTPTEIELGDARFSVGERGSSSGTLEGEHGPCKWDLRWTRADDKLAQSLCLLPYDAMIDGPFPKSKLLTPFPQLQFCGSLSLWGESFELERWSGMQGHNWGKEHAWEYAWGQCQFPAADGTPNCWVEGFSGRIRLAGMLTPLLSAMVIRRGEREYRFDRVFDFWRQDATIHDLGWDLNLRSPDGQAHLSMRAAAQDMVCLGYQNPTERMSYCLNSKLARVSLRVNPVNEAGFECVSEYGGALEFLRNKPDERFSKVV